jgi:hypothetical protein
MNVLNDFKIKRFAQKARDQRRYDINGRSQMPRGKNGLLPKEINAN